MKLVRTDTDLGTQSVLTAVGKARACVHHHAAAIDVRDKVVLHGCVFGNHRFGVAAAVLLDMVAGFGDVVHELDARLEGEVLVVVTAVLATFNNIGPGLSLVGPTCNYGFLSVFSKWTLIFDMLAGRLELFPILVLFAPSLYKK